MHYFFRFCSLVIVLIFLSAGTKSDQGILDQDAEINIKALQDQAGLLNGYQAYIKTPICETANCYTVEIKFNWDLMGRFQGFDTIPGAGLTKLDHIPFTEADYQKLDQILRDADAPLAHYEKEDLVRDTRNSAIDGFTGATILEIKESVISGGVYSCYTLWHLAHGTLVDSLQKKTYQQLDTALLEKMVAMQDQAINYFLLHYFTESDYHQYLPQFLQTFEYSSGYYPKQAIEKMPREVLHKQIVQDFFATYFDRLNYFAQVSLLKKLQPDNLSSAMRQTLEKQLETRNSSKHQLLKELLGVDRN